MNDNPEPQSTSLDETPASAKKSRLWLWVILSVALLGVLAAAAFLGGRYLQRGSLAVGGGGDGIVLSSNGPGGPVTRIIKDSDILPAEELPKTAADVRGIFVRRQDNSLFVGTGRVQLQVKVSGDSGATPESASSYDGPLVEVVTTNNTQVYKDDTFQDLPEQPASGAKIQQKVVPGSLDEVGQNSAVSAWGKKVGDRLVADVILYSNPVFGTGPGGK
jgi:hypothetical protein